MQNKKSLISWCIFDWANSAFPTVILTFVFATYFTEKVAINKIIGTEQWGYAVAVSGLFIAVLSPIFGSIADYTGRRKIWLAFFTLMTIIASALMWRVMPSHHSVMFTLVCLVLGTVGVEVGVVFYNAMLHDLAPKNYIGRLSGWGWGCGYFGGLTCLTVTLIVFIQHGQAWFGLSKSSYETIRIVGPFVAIWFLVFSLPLFFLTQEKTTGTSQTHAIKKGLKTLAKTLRDIRQFKNIAIFLIARLFYIDGLNTIFAFGGIYAAGQFGMSFAQILEFGIAMNVAAGLGAMGFAWLDDLWGSKQTVLTAIFIMLIAGAGILLTKDKTTFWILGMCLSLCVGPTQAASRSLMLRMVPDDKVTEFFGLYALSGKATAFLGPWLVGLMTVTFASQRAGMSMAFALLLIGGSILALFVRPVKN